MRQVSEEELNTLLALGREYPDLKVRTWDDYHFAAFAVFSDSGNPWFQGGGSTLSSAMTNFLSANFPNATKVRGVPV